MTVILRTNPRPPGATRAVHLSDLKTGDTAYLPSTRVEEHPDEHGLRLEVRVTWHGPFTVRAVREFGDGYAIDVKPCPASEGYTMVTIHGRAVTYGAYLCGEVSR